MKRPESRGAQRPAFSDLARTCYAGTVEAASDLLIERALDGSGGYVCLCNVHVLELARRDHELQQALAGAWLRLPDGAPVAWLQRRLGRSAAERVGGPDLMRRMLELGQSRDLRHFFLGSTPPVLAALEQRVLADAPAVTIAGALSPPFAPLTSDVLAAVLDAIRAARPHVVWVGLGAPKQEFWMPLLASQAPTVSFVGVGAAFDFLAGTKARAPRWMRRTGLEWLHRLLTEPRRLSGRYLRSNTEFVTQIVRELPRRGRVAERAR